jgi:hypothetical protein
MPAKGPLTIVGGSFIMDSSIPTPMNLKVIQFTNGTQIIADVEELEEEPSCYLKNCYQILNGELEEWPEYTSEREALIYADRILTISEPHPDIVKKIPS